MSDPETPQDDGPADDEPKLVVDTDWKEQVAREKQAAAAHEDGDATIEIPIEDVSEAEVPVDDPAVGPGDLPPPPPASFDVLISMLFTQALASLGQMPDPGGEMKVNKPYAKHFIDTLEMLGEKTEGNLSDDESKMLSEALHALRMAYVNVKG